MAIKIGTISISLSAETSSFQTGMEKASQMALNSSRNIERSFAMMGTAIAGATTAAVGALSYLIGRTEETVFQMQKMAQQAGVSVGSFSKLAYAAKVAGMPVDQLAVIMTRLSHTAYEAGSQGSTAGLQMKEAWQAVGISVTDSAGHFKMADQLIVELAKKLDKYKESSAKTGIETMLMGRSGAQAAELLNVLANRFDEISAKAEKLGVVFNMTTAVQAQKLHDSFIDLQEAGVGLSVRLLSAVSPALDELAQKVVAFVSNGENMKMVDQVAQELAHGIKEAGDAFAYLLDHAETVKHVFEGLALIRLAGVFVPMVASASGANGVFKNLGIASLNLAGNLLGVRKVGTLLVPTIIDGARAASTAAKDYTAFSAALGVAQARSLFFQTYIARIPSLLAETVAPFAVAAGAVYALGMAYEGIKADEMVAGDTGAGFWQRQKAEHDQAFSSLSNYLTYLKATILLNKQAQAEFYGGAEQRLKAAWSPLDKKLRPWAPQPSQNDGTNSGQSGLKDLAALPEAEKVDQLKKKLDELQESARAAKTALSLVGTTPQQQQDAEVVDKYNKFLIDEKVNLDKLTPKQQEAAHGAAYLAIWQEVSAKAAEKYTTELYELAQATDVSIKGHLEMAVAINKSAKAMQDAQVAAQVNKEFQKYGPNWQSDPKKLADSQLRGAAIRADMNAASTEADVRSQDAAKQQLDAQQKLNAAILKGVEARRQAQISPFLLEGGLLCETDTAILGAYCSAFAGYLDAKALVERDGLVVMVESTTRTGKTAKPIRNPAVTLMLDFQRAMLAAAAKLGFSPFDRERIEGSKSPDESEQGLQPIYETSPNPTRPAKAPKATVHGDALGAFIQFPSTTDTQAGDDE